MAIESGAAGSGEQVYEEREAVAVFPDERSLTAAADALMQAGLAQSDMSVLGRVENLSTPVERLADRDDTPRAAYVSPDSATEGQAGLVGLPAYLAGAGAAALVATGGTALIPAIAIAAGSGLAGGAFGLLLARAFGRHRAAYIEQQIMDGGLLLWVRADDPAKDKEIAGILAANGGRDVHIHVAKRSWGVADVPLHDAEPDPLLR